MVRHVDKSSLLIHSKHCENESGDCMYPGRLYVSYHKVYTNDDESWQSPTVTGDI